MRAVLICRKPNGIGAWSVKFRGVTVEVLAATGIDACITVLDMA